jgi:hypothetical protein
VERRWGFADLISRIPLAFEPRVYSCPYQFTNRAVPGAGDAPEAIKLRLGKENLHLFHGYIICMDK